LTSEILKGSAEDLVTDLDGVDVSCTPPELSVKLHDSNDTHTYQWTFTLVFKVCEIRSDGKRSSISDQLILVKLVTGSTTKLNKQ